MMRVSVDRDICVAGGHCVLQAPEVFDQDEQDGQVILLQPEPPADQEDNVREAAQLCPAAAIFLA